MRRAVIAAFALAALLLGRPSAAPAQSVGSCTIDTNLGPGVVFGPYDPLSGAAVSTVWVVSWHCPFGQGGYSVTFSPGNAGNARKRYMVDALGEQLKYNLYLDAGYTTIWGDGSNGTQFLTGPASTQTTYKTDIFAQIAGGQKNVSAYQNFIDWITATINF